MWFIIWVRTLIWVTRRLNVVSKFFRKGEQLQLQPNKCWVTAWVWSFWAQGCIDAVYLQVSTVLSQENKHHPDSHKKWKYWKDWIVQLPQGSSFPEDPIIIQSKILYLQEHLYGATLTPIKDSRKFLSTCKRSQPHKNVCDLHAKMFTCSHIILFSLNNECVKLVKMRNSHVNWCGMFLGIQKVQFTRDIIFLSDIKGWK